MALSAFEAVRSSRVVVSTAPAVEPVTLTEAKDHLRIDDSSSDTLVSSLIVAARQQVEQDTGRALITQTLDVYYDALPTDRELWVPNPKLQSVTTFTTYDEDDASTVFSSWDYLVDVASEPGRIVLNADATWPTDLRAANAVIVRVVAGYGVAAAVPQALKQAILLIISTLYEHREQVIISQFAGQFIDLPFGYRQLITPYRIWLV
jgi:uncharacterized phiE125 gp8 family phage protein